MNWRSWVDCCCIRIGLAIATDQQVDRSLLQLLPQVAAQVAVLRVRPVEVVHVRALVAALPAEHLARPADATEQQGEVGVGVHDRVRSGCPDQITPFSNRIEVLFGLPSSSAAWRTLAAGTPVTASVLSGVYLAWVIDRLESGEAGRVDAGVDVGLVVQVLGQDHVHQRVEQHDVGVRLQLQVHAAEVDRRSAPRPSCAGR